MKEIVMSSRSLRIAVVSAVLICGAPGERILAQDVASVLAPADPTITAAAGFTQTTAAGDALHIVAGRSMFISTKVRLRRVYIANPTILDSYMANPSQVVITAKTPGVCSLILWDENGQAQAYQVSADLDVSALSKAMKQALPLEDVHVSSMEGRVLLSGVVSRQESSDAAVKLATIYAKDVSNAIQVDRARIKQVRLKVRIVEIDRTKLNQFAFNILGADHNTTGTGGTTQFPATTVTNTPTSGHVNAQIDITDPLNFFLYSEKLNIGAALKDMENKQVLQILAEPTITTLVGQKASFLAGGEFPFPVVQGGAGGQTSISISFRPYGVKLDFMPLVNADGTIELKVMPEVSALDYSNAVQISGYTIPALSSRKADTQVTLRDGQSFAISGLLDRRTTDLLGRTPGISSIPILGALFKSKGITHSTSELIVIITPTIIDPLTDATSPVEPKMVIPAMDTDAFDKSLPVQTIQSMQKKK